jgi:hypothetical protein
LSGFQGFRIQKDYLSGLIGGGESSGNGENQDDWILLRKIGYMAVRGEKRIYTKTVVRYIYNYVQIKHYYIITYR